MSRHDRYLMISFVLFGIAAALCVWLAQGCSSITGPVTVTLDDVWRLAEHNVFSIPYKAYLSARPTFDEALRTRPINCSAQAVLLQGYLSQVIPAHNIEIMVWHFEQWAHVNVRVWVGGDWWIIDRNYGPGFPVLPMTETAWRTLYSRKLREVKS